VEFIIPNFSEREGQEPRTMSISEPMMTATSHGAGGLVETEAFILPKDAGWQQDYVHSVDYPVSTVQTTAHDNFVQPLLRVFTAAEPYVVQLNGQSTTMSTHEPITALTGCGHHYVSLPMIIHLRGDPSKDKTCSSVDVPSNSITANGTHEILAEAFLMAIDQAGKDGARDRTYSHDEPVKTITTKANQSIARIEIKQLEHFVRQATPDGVDASRVWALLEPLIDELKKRGRADVKPWVYVYYGSGAVGSDLDAPIPTVRTHENAAVCYPVLEIDGEFILFDLLYRMFTVLELQRAQGFPDDYKWTGSKTAQVRAIGNSVSCGVAEALTLAHYSQNSDISHFYHNDPPNPAIAA
jgi:hypothetical protein